MRMGTADAFRSPRLAGNFLSSFDIAGLVREAAGVKVKRTACLLVTVSDFAILF